MSAEADTAQQAQEELTRLRERVGELEGRLTERGLSQDTSPSLEDRVIVTLDNMLEGCQIIGPDWRYLYVNDAVARHGRTTKEKLLGQTMMDAYPGIEDTEMFAALRRCMEERVATRMENEFTYRDGQKGCFELSIEPAPGSVLILSVDITKRKAAEQRLSRTAHALRTLSGCNQVLIRATEESQLLRDVCRVIVKVAGYRLAWIGFAQKDPEKSVVPVAEAGYGERYVRQVSVTWADSPRGQGPTGTAIRSGEPVVCRDILADPKFAPWREEAVRLGYGSSIALPLITAEEVLGALNIYAPGRDAFDSQEVKLLEEMADDVAYGVEVLRVRARAEALNAELRESEHRYRLHFDQVSDVISAVDRESRIVTISPSVERLLGYRPEELIGIRFLEAGILAPGYREAATSDARRILDGARVDSAVYEFRAKDGTTRYGEVSGAPIVEGDEIQGVISVARDITDRVRAEQALEGSLRNLRRAFGGTIRTLRLIVESRDPYTAGHQRRVSHLARAIAMEMGLSRERTEGLRVAASIHDLGKLFVPVQVLTKPSPLTEIERELIETHPGAAYDILKNVDFPWPVAEIIVQHHERMNGSGYPHGIAGDEIMPEARVLMVADVVEAMSSHRPYRPAVGIEEALEEISRHRGVLYDPQAVDACLRLVREKGFELG
jgi:PAS domain S-box-containing protein